MRCGSFAPASPRIQLQWPIQLDAITAGPDMRSTEEPAEDTGRGLIPCRGLFTEYRAGSHQRIRNRRLLG
jgi:hypothetical protein